MFLSVFQVGFPTILRIYQKKKGIIGSVRGTRANPCSVETHMCTYVWPYGGEERGGPVADSPLVKGFLFWCTTLHHERRK